MPDLSLSPSTPLRERGVLLIADMESSTLSKFLLGDVEAFHALRLHNRTVAKHCRGAPVPGIVLNSLGDAVVVKFPATEDLHEALVSAMTAARDTIQAFERIPPVNAPDGREFQIRTKVLLQVYNAFGYGADEAEPRFADELVGTDIDLAFRLSPVAWRFQVLVTETCMAELLKSSNGPTNACEIPQALLDRARVARHEGALAPGPLRGIAQAHRLGALEYWLTDAREIARLKGIESNARVFALTFTEPATLIERGEHQRLSIKVRQPHHALILASISFGPARNDNYIEHVVEKLRDATHGNRLDSELTLIAAAKIFGEFDFFFRVSCIDDASLRRFFDAIRADSYGVSHVEVRSMIAERFAVTRYYEMIHRRFLTGPYEIVLTWFERLPGRDIFQEMKTLLEREPVDQDGVRLLEVGEVIHHTPVYAIFVCSNLGDYARFFTDNGLNPTACRSHVGHIEQAADAQLRYSLLDGVFLPRGADHASG